ncbi:MAG: RNA 2',3'-cyclic phosphodiesterase [Deltaproteobacteria bacterium]|nr:RNA 2',3'-cyclic phosphodiesterase [Deltaproteobacteria bacterium]
MRQISGVRAELDRGFRDIAWVRPEGIHLTLKFLGEVDEERVSVLTDALNAAKQGVMPFAVKVGRIGAFPDMSRPRVLWAGVDGKGGLIQLQQNIEEALFKLGFEKETRPFSPHLTLCRIKSFKEGSRLAVLAEELKDRPDAEFKVTSYALIKSVLSPKGAVYSIVKRFVLDAG